MNIVNKIKIDNMNMSKMKKVNGLMIHTWTYEINYIKYFC